MKITLYLILTVLLVSCYQKSNDSEISSIDYETSDTKSFIKTDTPKTEEEEEEEEAILIEEQKEYNEIGYLDNYELLTKLEFTETSKEEFDSIPAQKAILPQIEQTKSHFYINTKNGKQQFNVYKDYGGELSYSGYEFVGYFPEINIYAITSYSTAEYMGFGTLYLYDSLSGENYEIVSIGDGPVGVPISSPNNKFMVYFYNYVYKDNECFIGLLKIDGENKYNPKKYLIEIADYTTKEWAIENLKWINDNIFIIKGYKSVYENEKWVKYYSYFKTTL